MLPAEPPEITRSKKRCPKRTPFFCIFCEKRDFSALFSRLFPQGFQPVHNTADLEGCGLPGGIGHKHRQGLGNRPGQHNDRQAQIDEQIHPVRLRSDAEALQNAFEEPPLPGTEGAEALLRKPLEQHLLLIHAEHRHSIPAAIAAGIQELPHPFPPADRRVFHPAAGIFQQAGLLQIERLYDQILLGGEKA